MSRLSIRVYELGDGGEETTVATSDTGEIGAPTTSSVNLIEGRWPPCQCERCKTGAPCT